MSPDLDPVRAARAGHAARATVNLGVRHPIVDLAFDRTLPRTAWAVEGHVWTRLGMLLPAGIDTWWAGTETAEVGAAMDAQGLPWLRAHADPRHAMATLQQEGDGLRALELAVVLGDRRAARRAADQCRDLAAHHTDAGARTEFERRWRDALARLDAE